MTRAKTYIAPWVRIAAPARDEVLRRWRTPVARIQAAACERAGVRISLTNLMTFPFIRQRVEDGVLSLLWLVLRFGER